MRFRHALALAALAGVALVALVGGPAAAQPKKEPSGTELALAKDMLKDALTEEKAGRCADALAMLKQVAAIKETGEVLMHMGDCQAKLGDINDAEKSYLKAEELARTDKDKTTQQALVGKLAEVRERIPAIKLLVPESAKDVKLKVDGEDVASDSLDKPIPLRPGDHRVEVTATGKKPFVKTVTVAEKERQDVTVVFETDDGGKGAAAPGPSPYVDKDKGAKIPLVTWVAGGAAVLLTAAGVVTFVVAGSKASDAADACAKSVTCDESPRDSVRTLDATSLGLWIGAGISAGVAVTFFVLEQKKEPASTGAARLTSVTASGRDAPYAPARPTAGAKLVVRPGSVAVVGQF